jgi:hypothetical protein
MKRGAVVVETRRVVELVFEMKDVVSRSGKATQEGGCLQLRRLKQHCSVKHRSDPEPFKRKSKKKKSEKIAREKRS